MKLLPSRNRPSTRSPRREMLTNIAQAIMAIMVVLGSLVAIGGCLGNANWYVPKTAAGVLNSVDQGSSYVWALETLATIELQGGVSDRFGTVRTAAVDLKRNRFQATVSGVFPDATAFLSDGQTSIYRTEMMTEQGQAGQLLNDVCGGERTIPAQTLALPSAEALKAAGAEIVRDDASYTGLRAWELKFKPTGAIVERLLWMPFFDKAAPRALEWALPAADRQALRSGSFKLLAARMLVTRDKPRRIAQITIELELPVSGTLALLATLHPSRDSDPLRRMQISKPPC